MAQASLNQNINIAGFLLDGTMDVACAYTPVQDNGTHDDNDEVGISGRFREVDDLSIGTGKGQTPERRSVKAKYAVLFSEQSDLTDSVKYGDRIKDPSGNEWFVYNFRPKGSGLFKFYLVDKLRAGGGNF